MSIGQKAEFARKIAVLLVEFDPAAQQEQQHHPKFVYRAEQNLMRPILPWLSWFPHRNQRQTATLNCQSSLLSICTPARVQKTAASKRCRQKSEILGRTINFLHLRQ